MSQKRSRRSSPTSRHNLFLGLAEIFARLFSRSEPAREGLARNNEGVVGVSRSDIDLEPLDAEGLMMDSSEFENVEDEPARSGLRSSRQFHRPSPKTLRGFWPVFWTITGSVSILLNVVLIAGLLLVGRQLFVLKALVSDDLLSGLYENFVLMDNATITTQVHISKDIPVTFNLPLDQETVVTLTQYTPIYGANVALNSGGVIINAPADIVLPIGQELPVRLQLNVPVSVTVPVELDVPVSIPLSSTELHQPFVGLREVIGEFYDGTLPDIKKPEDLVFCQNFPSLCEYYFK